MMRIGEVSARTPRLPLWCLLCLPGILATSCAPLVQTGDGRELRATSEAFRDYIESVFRRQNKVSMQLSLAIDGEEREAVLRELERIDRRLLEACRPLNELALARRAGRSVDLDQQRALVDAAPLCECATAQAESVLHVLGYRPVGRPANSPARGMPADF